MGFFDKAQDFVSDAFDLGYSNAEKPTDGGKASVGTPWDVDKSQSQESFFGAQSIDSNRWNRVYPYRLLVWDVKDNKIVTGDGGGISSDDITTIYFNHGTDYIISQTASQTQGWIVDLPITPQQLNITDQFAINTSATMRGIVEEHNGVKFKLISAQGTTGYWPTRPTQGAKLQSPTVLGSLFGGTIEAIGDVAAGVEQVKSAFTGEHPNKLEPASSPSTMPDLANTGYYQAHLLAQFFERYAMEKKKAKNKHWRLVFDIPKQNQSFIVTPVTFSLQQNQQKPTEILFNFQLKAWKRIELKTGYLEKVAELPDLSPNALQRVITGISGVRSTLGASMNLVKAVRRDFRKPLDILRQTSLAVKDLGGLGFAVADLAPSIIEDYKSSIKESLLNIKNAFKRPKYRGGTSGVTTGSSPSPTGTSIKSQSLTAKAGAAVNAIVDENKRHEGLSEQAVLNGALGTDAALAQQTNNLNEVFQNPEENYELFNSINVDELPLTPEQEQLIEDELEEVRLITINDLREYRQEIENLMLDLSNYFGAGDETYSTVYNRPDPKERAVDMTIEENEILLSLMEALQSYDLLIATKAWDDNKIASPLEYIGGLANEAGIDFENYPSKYLAPVPFGLTIEQIAARYLGDPDKWIEIVTLNNLRSPYIDEEGFSYSLLSNAEGRQFTVDDSDEMIYIGQTLTLQSDTVPAFTRKVVNVEEISDNNYLITVDGLDDLDKLTTVDNARIQGYLAGTINSQNQIYIPIDEPSLEDDRTFTIPYLDEQRLTKLSKIDWLLTDEGDLAINSTGDFRLANGLTNLVQAVKLKVKTKRGSLLRHLDYGLGLQHGISVANIESGEIINSLNQMIQADGRFDSIERIDIKLKDSTLAIDMAVKLANQTGIIPITFDV